MRDLRPSKGHRHHSDPEKPWQETDGLRYGNKRKMIARLKKKDRKRGRSANKKAIEEQESADE